MTKDELLEELQRRKAEANEVGANAPVSQVLDVIMNLVQSLDGVDAAPRMIPTAEAAKILGLSSNTVAKLCRGGRIPGAAKTSDGGDWRIPVDQV